MSYYYYFRDGGGQYIANSLRNNRTVRELQLEENHGGFENKAFCEALVESLALNKSITDVQCCGPMKTTTFLNLLQRIARENNTIARIWFSRDPLRVRQLSRDQERDLLASLRQNYTIESIENASNEADLRKQIETITRLNQAGRRYLREDANSKSKCIAVLAKVKNNLDCLYFHLRENPIFFTFDARSADGNVNRKRKAEPQSARGESSKRSYSQTLAET